MLGTAISSQGSQYTAEQFVAFVYTSESSYEAIIYYKDEKRFKNALGGGGWGGKHLQFGSDSPLPVPASVAGGLSDSRVHY